jgi:hypothetical protein
MGAELDARLAWLDARSPAAVRLAELASFAARIDTGLLRRLRQQLLPDADVSAESDLWFSPIVESRSGTGFQIAPELLAPLRDRLLMPDRPAVGVVRQVVDGAHANASPAIRLEETINGIALEHGSAGVPAIEQTLRPVLSALARGDGDAIDVARWIVPAVPRLHPLVRETPTARTTVLSAALLLRGRARLGSGGTPDPSVRISTLGWALSGPTASQRIGIEFVQGGLQFRQPSASSGLVDAPITDPMIVEVEWTSGQGVQRRLTPATEGVLVPLEGDPDEVTITTLLGDQYRVTASLGAGSARERHAEFPPSSLLQACDQIEPLGRDEPIGVVFAIGETLLLGASTSIREYPILGVHGDLQQLEVIGGQTEARVNDGPQRVVALRPVRSLGKAKWSRLRLEVPVEDRALRAAAAGFVKGKAAWYDVALAPPIADSHLTRRGVLFQPPNVSADELVAGFTGSPIVAEARAIGVIVRITPPQPHESFASIEFLDGPHLLAAQRSAGPQAPAFGPMVFLGSEGADEDAVKRIVQALNEAGFTVHLDRWSSSEDPSRVREEYEAAIGASDFFLAVISRSVQRAKLRQQLRDVYNTLAKRQPSSSLSSYFVPILIDDLSTAELALGSPFQELQWVKAPDGELPAGFVQLLRDKYEERTREPARPSSQENANVVSPRDDVERFMDLLLNPDLRRMIEQLLRRSGPRVLLVDGPPNSAVDEVSRFVDRAIRREQDLTVRFQRIQMQDGLDARELAELIAARDGVDVSAMPRLEEEQLARGIQRLSRWVFSAFARDNATRVFVLSGFEYAVPQVDVLDFVDNLILNAASASGLVSCILLNYRRDLPREVESMATRYTLQPLDERAIREFFGSVFESTGRPYEARIIDDVTRQVLERPGPLPLDYNELRPYLEQAAEALIRPLP